MPKDIRISLDPVFLEGDFGFDESAQDLETDEGLETSVIISLFTDKRAEKDDILPDESNLDRRGWWGDLISNFENDQIGSKLWLLNREKTETTVLVRAKKYVEEALQWMIDDGVAMKIETDVERQGNPGNDVLAIKVRIHRGIKSTVLLQYELQWNAQALR